MSKLVALDRRYWPLGGYAHWCPGCGYGHEINVDEVNSSGAKWSFNNDPRKPTFQPSVNMRVNTPDMGERYQPDVESTVCHYFIRDGRIMYLADSTHRLSGQTVDLPDIPSGQYMTSARL